jgi:hypothetical protein
MNTLVNVRATAGPASRTGASRPRLALAVQFLVGALETLSRPEATQEGLRRRRYAALLDPKS